MSIVTLKRKTNVQYNNMSVGQKTFSLNGTRRSQGYIGQTSLSRSLPKTLMKGNVACGYGGCCGQYDNKQIIQSAVTSLNSNDVLKTSVINTLGMTTEKYKCIPGPNHYSNKTPSEATIKKLNTVKPDCNNNINTQKQYIDSIVKKTLQGITSKNAIYNNNNPSATNAYCNYNTYYSLQSFKNRAVPQITKSAYNNKNPSYINSYDDYLKQKDNLCTNADVKYVANTLNKTPLPTNNLINIYGINNNIQHSYIENMRILWNTKFKTFDGFSKGEQK